MDMGEAAQPQLDGLPVPRRIIAVFALSMGTILLMMDASIANVGLPIIAHDLHVPGSASVLLVAVYNLVLAMMLMPLATLGMYIGLRRVFQAGLAAYLAGAVLSWFVHGFVLLLVVRGIQALGAAAALSVGSALVRLVYPRHQLGRGLGLNTLFGAIGGAIAPVIGGMIVSHASWHWVFVAGVPAALAALATGRALPDPAHEARHFDLPGALLCAATFGLLISGLRCVTAANSAYLPALLLLAGVAAATFLVRHEIKVPHPVLPVDLLRQPTLALSVAAGLCGYIASMSVLLALPFHLHHAGYSAAQIGEVIMPYALAASIFAPTSGMLSDKIPPSILGTVGLAIAVGALLLLSRLPEVPTHMQVSVPIALCGVGFGIFMAPNARLIIGAVDAARASSASSLISTTRMMSQAIGSTFVGGLLSIGVWPAAPLSAVGLTAIACGLSAARIWVAREELTNQFV